MSEKKAIRNVAFCPHCGNKAPQKLVYSNQYLSYGFDMQGNKTADDMPAAYFVAECETCHEILVYLAEAYIPEKNQFSDIGLIWPDPGYLGKGVPESIREIYKEAIRIINLAPNAFAVQIRRALEALCDDRGENKGSLYDRLKGLVKKNEIPPVLSEMSHVIRLIGNVGAHGKDQNVKPGHVGIINEFFRTIIEYVYIAPQKVEQLKEQIKLLNEKKN